MKFSVDWNLYKLTKIRHYSIMMKNNYQKSVFLFLQQAENIGLNKGLQI